MTQSASTDTTNQGSTALPNTMQAWTRTSYGTPDVLSLTDEPVPEVGADQVLVEIRATSMNAADWHMTTGSPYLVRLQAGLRAPKSNSTGLDVAGVVAAVGSDVTRWAIGDRVFGDVFGAFADYVVAREAALTAIPEGVSFEDAAALPVAGVTALQALRDRAEVSAGESIIIVGASGSVGTYAIQLAKAMGLDVTAVVSTGNVEMASRLGADTVIDYRKGEFEASRSTFDVVLDIAGLRRFSAMRRLLSPEGRYVLIGGPKGDWLGPLPYMLGGMARLAFSKQSFKGMLAKANADDFEVLAGHLADGSMVSEIAQIYEWSDLPKALTRLGEGHTPAKLVVRR